MKKKLFWIIVIIIILLCVIFTIAAMTGKKAADTNAEKDVTATVKENTVEVKAKGTGTVVPKNKQYPDYNDLEVSLQMDEIDIPQVKKGQEVTIDVTAFPDQKFRGKVKSISEKGNVENNVSVFTVTVGLNESKNLKAGMTVSASILVNKKEHTLNIPIEAVQKNNHGQYYVLLRKKTKKVKQTIETGIRNDNIIEVKKGLQKGEKILLPSTSADSN